MHIRNILKSFEKYKCPSIAFFSRTPDRFPMSSYVSNQLDRMMIFYFYLVCFNFSISYSVLPVHLVSVLQFLHLFCLSLSLFCFLDVLPQAFIKCSIKAFVYIYMGFPGSSAGKESACNAGYPSSSPWSGRSPGEGIGYPLWYSLASVMAQMVKNTCKAGDVGSVQGWKDPLEEGMAIHSSILAWRIPMGRGSWRATIHGVTKSWTQLSD